MSRKQVETDFSQLYVGQNLKLLVENYYKKKKKDMLWLSLAAVILAILLLYVGLQERSIGEEGLLRNGFGEGVREVDVEVLGPQGKWERIGFTLEEKEYTREEIEESCDRLEEVLPMMILGENESLDAVRENLELMTEIEDYPLFLSWTSSEPDIVSHGGEVFGQTLSEEGKTVCLTVEMSYGEWIREHSLFVRVLPLEKQNGFLWDLSEQLKKGEEESRQERGFLLPDSLEGMALSWRYPMRMDLFFPILLFPVLLVMVWRERDKEIHRQAGKRQEDLLHQYPEFVGKLILLMEAGMTARGAIFRIVEDDRKKRGAGKRQECLYEELSFICRQMENGMGEIEVYELLGERCQIPIYRKLSTLLIQYVQRGAYGMMDTLRQESRQANEERKNRVKRLGEEAGTKMLFPMMLMLGIVMIFIMVPACFSFQL